MAENTSVLVADDVLSDASDVLSDADDEVRSTDVPTSTICAPRLLFLSTRPRLARISPLSQWYPVTD